MIDITCWFSVPPLTFRLLSKNAGEENEKPFSPGPLHSWEVKERRSILLQLQTGMWAWTGKQQTKGIVGSHRNFSWVYPFQCSMPLRSYWKFPKAFPSHPEKNPLVHQAAKFTRVDFPVLPSFFHSLKVSFLVATSSALAMVWKASSYPCKCLSYYHTNVESLLNNTVLSHTFSFTNDVVEMDEAERSSKREGSGDKRLLICLWN